MKTQTNNRALESALSPHPWGEEKQQEWEIAVGALRKLSFDIYNRYPIGPCPNFKFSEQEQTENYKNAINIIHTFPNAIADEISMRFAVLFDISPIFGHNLYNMIYFNPNFKPSMIDDLIEMANMGKFERNTLGNIETPTWWINYNPQTTVG